MADVKLINILPQQLPGVSQPQVAGGSSAPAVPVNISVGTVLSGFILNRDNSGNPILRSDSGDITFESNFFLKIGSEVTIRIENTGGNIAARLVTVNGLAPELAAQQSNIGQEPEVIVSNTLLAATAPTQTPANAPVNISINGTLVQPAVTETGEPVQPAGAQVALKIVSVQAPPAPTTQAAAPAQTAVAPAPVINAAYARAAASTPTIAPNVPAAAQTAPTVQAPVVTTTAPTENAPTQTPQAVQTLLPTAVQATPQTQNAPLQVAQQNTPIVETLPATPPQTPAPAPATPAPAATHTTQIPATPQPEIAAPAALPQAPVAARAIPQTGELIHATVIAQSSTGEALVQTPLGTVRLQPGVQLPVGSKITFELGQITSPEAQSLAGSANVAALASAPAPITELAHNWASLQNIFTLLSGLDTPDAQNFLSNNLPNIFQSGSAANAQRNTPPDFTATMMNFVTALSSGDFKTWLGRTNAKWLEDNGHDDLLKKADGEFTTLARQWAAPPQPQSWQSLFFPIAVAGELQQARLFVKRDKKEKDENGKRKQEDDTRFVVEVDLSQLGQMQMDGFVRRREGDINFDLVIRSHTALSPEAQNDIMQIYTSTGELTGYKGSVAFQAVREFPVNPMEEITKEHLKGIVA